MKVTDVNAVMKSCVTTCFIVHSSVSLTANLNKEAPGSWTTHSVRDRRALAATHEDGLRSKPRSHDFGTHILFIRDPFWVESHDLGTTGIVGS